MTPTLVSSLGEDLLRPLFLFDLLV